MGDTVRKDGGCLQVFPPLTPNPWNGAVVTRRTSKVHVHMLVKALGDLRISHVWVQNACKPFQTGFGLARQRPKEHFLFGWAVHGACASHGLLHSLHRENPSSNGTTRRSHNVGNPGDPPPKGEREVSMYGCVIYNNVVLCYVDHWTRQ